MNKRSRQLAARIARIWMMSLLLTCLLCSSFPVSSIAASGMSCCTAKSTSHCHAKIRVRKPLPEPMCGLKSSAPKEAAADDETDLPTRVSATQMCDRDCSGCATSQTQQQKRFGTTLSDKVINVTFFPRPRQTSSERVANSRHSIEPFSPRGPPALL